MRMLIVTAISNSYDDWDPLDFSSSLSHVDITPVVFTDDEKIATLAQNSGWIVVGFDSHPALPDCLINRKFAIEQKDRVPKLFMPELVRYYKAEVGVWVDANIRSLPVGVFDQVEKLHTNSQWLVIFFKHPSRSNKFEELLAIFKKRKMPFSKLSVLVLRIFVEHLQQLVLSNGHKNPSVLTMNGVFLVRGCNEPAVFQVFRTWRDFHDLYGPRDQISLALALERLRSLRTNFLIEEMTGPGLTNGTPLLRAPHRRF